MRIKEIKIRNIGGIEKQAAKLEKITVLMGKNGAGKSSFLKALKFGLVGDKSANLVRTGASEGEVCLLVEGHTVYKSKSDKGTKVRLDGKTTTQKSVNEFFEGIGANAETMKFVTSSEMFDNCSSKEFGEYLLNSGFVSPDIDIEDFITVCKKTSGISEEIEEELRNRLPSSPAKFTLDDVGNLFKLYDNKRKISAREVDRLAVIGQELKTNPKINNFLSSGADRKAIQEELSQMQAKLAAYNAYIKNVEYCEKHENAIKALAEEVAKDKSERPNLLKRDNLLKLIDVENDKLNKAKRQIAVIKANNEQHNKSLERLKSNKCPLSDKLVCMQDKSELIDELETVMYNNGIELVCLETEIVEATNKKEEYLNEIEAISRVEKNYNEKLSKIQKLEALKKVSPPKLGKVELEANFTERLEELKDSEFTFGQIDTLSKVKRSYENEVEKLIFYKKLAIITSPKGDVCNFLLEEICSIMVDGLNETASHFCPHLKMSGKVVDGKVNILCNDRDYSDLSTGERLLVQFLVMHQINNFSGLRILVLDNLDKLDCEQFRNFIDFLEAPAVQAEYDNIFVAAVNHDDFIDVLKTRGNIQIIKM